jgi:hypothetical protein
MVLVLIPIPYISRSKNLVPSLVLKENTFPLPILKIVFVGIQFLITIIGTCNSYLLK